VPKKAPIRKPVPSVGKQSPKPLDPCLKKEEAVCDDKFDSRKRLDAGRFAAEACFQFFRKHPAPPADRRRLAALKQANPTLAASFSSDSEFLRVMGALEAAQACERQVVQGGLSPGETGFDYWKALAEAVRKEVLKLHEEAAAKAENKNAQFPIMMAFKEDVTVRARTHGAAGRGRRSSPNATSAIDLG
jgi:hypothetical protein